MITVVIKSLRFRDLLQFNGSFRLSHVHNLMNILRFSHLTNINTIFMHSKQQTVGDTGVDKALLEREIQQLKEQVKFIG